VQVESGGKLARNHAELAAHVLELVRSPELLLEREERAQTNTPSPRPWSEVAREFLAQLAKCEK